MDLESGNGGDKVKWSLNGVTCMAISSAAYSMMGLLVKLLTVRSFTSSQIVALRCTIIALLSGVELRRIHHPLLGSPGVRLLVLFRAALGFVALSTYFYSIQLLPLRDATILNFTTPVFTAIFAACSLRETWGPREATGTLCSFIGVLFVMKPEGSLAKRENIHGAIMALIGASTGALSYILVRVIGKRGEPPAVSVFVFAALSAPLAAITAFSIQGVKMPNLLESFQLCGVGLSAYAAQIFLTRGLQLEKAARATSIQYIKVVCSYILGLVFLGEKPSLVSALGAVCIALSAAFVSGKTRLRPGSMKPQ